VNEHVAALIETEERHFRIFADRLKYVIDRSETINEPIAVGKPRVTKDIGNAERMERRHAMAVWHITGQFEENLRQQKIAFDHFEELRRLLRHADRKGSGMNL
jgi:hypothetical protein